MKGCDQNIFATETWAVFQALNAAHVTGINVSILCDSQAVVSTAERVEVKFLGSQHVPAVPKAGRPLGIQLMCGEITMTEWMRQFKLLPKLELIL